MWGATAGCLAASDSGALCELIIALGELQLVPPASWLQLYFAAASNAALQYRPWQLAGTAAAVGKLAVASRAGSRPKQQQQQQVADQTGCKVWVGATLSAVVQQLPAFAARDLSALLSGLAALQVQVSSAQLQALLAEMQAKLPRLNTAGLAAVTEAVVDLCQQQVDQQQQQVEGQQQQQQQVEGQQEDGIPTKFAQQQQQQVTPPVLHVAGGFMDALLREVAVKLPVFPAEDLARVLLAVAAAGVQPSQLWCQVRDTLSFVMGHLGVTAGLWLMQCLCNACSACQLSTQHHTLVMVQDHNTSTTFTLCALAWLPSAQLPCLCCCDLLLC
jgi:hypothetical protein